MTSVDLIWLGKDSKPPKWQLGQVHCSGREIGEVAKILESVERCEVDGFLLLWDSSLGHPSADVVLRATRTNGDLWHAGLRLGLERLPSLLNFIVPTWMWNCDPDSSTEATSWRLSLRCCLLPRRALRLLGGPLASFNSLEAAGLELGLRYAKAGVMCRHLPWLAPSHVRAVTKQLPLQDEVQFLLLTYGRMWSAWACIRAIMTGTVGLKSIIETAGLILSSVPRRDVPAYHTGGAWQHVRPVMDTVTVVIPTIDRYPYLGTLLKQLSSQTVKPYEVLIVDQTPLERRQSQLYSEIESDFPIRVVWMDQPGQCSSRNAAINMATGEKILLLDDDIEVRANFIESHLKMFSLFRCDVSSGVSVEAAAPLSRDFQRIRVSDVFPAGNSMVNRKTLMQSGLFDIAYDKSERADADLGMRIFKTGALMVLNPGIDVLHHKADRGGLRNHRARVITYASSRDRLLHRHLPSVSEIYFARRYFHPSQVREMLWLRGMGTLAGRGHLLYRIAKAVIGIVLLPTTVRQIWKRYDASALVFRNHPQIPTLADSARAVSTVQ